MESAKIPVLKFAMTGNIALSV